MPSFVFYLLLHNFYVNIGASKKRTRGPTQCLSIHARPTQDRQEIILDDYGEPIGPTDKIVSDLSYFLGTIARNSEFCPLIYTNFKVVPVDYKDRMWEYGNVWGRHFSYFIGFH